MVIICKHNFEHLLVRVLIVLSVSSINRVYAVRPLSGRVPLPLGTGLEGKSVLSAQLWLAWNQIQECKLEECPSELWPGIQLRKFGGFRIAAMIKKALCHNVIEGELFCNAGGHRGAAGRKNYMVIMMIF